MPLWNALSDALVLEVLWGELVDLVCLKEVV